jgi:hypothetical protein
MSSRATRLNPGPLDGAATGIPDFKGSSRDTFRGSGALIDDPEVAHAGHVGGVGFGDRCLAVSDALISFLGTAPLDVLAELS